jgi:hypothetical protein
LELSFLPERRAGVAPDFKAVCFLRKHPSGKCMHQNQDRDQVPFSHFSSSLWSDKAMANSDFATLSLLMAALYHPGRRIN